MYVVIVKNSVLPATLYGGTERVAWSLGHALARMGHKVAFLCRKGSVCDFAQVIPIDDKCPLSGQIPADADIVHFNDAVPAGYERPHIVTINGNLAQGEAVPPMAVFVSRNHARRHGSSHFVYNGLDWCDYPAAELELTRSYFHFLGNAAWRVKNVTGAIRIVKAHPQAELHVLGGRRLNLKMGFRFTASRRVHFHGMVDNRQKARIISRSRGLVFPVLWDEPFGLCITESLFYGSPVFGTTRGSLPEIVTADVGVLSDDEQELTHHLTDNFKPYVCHQYAVECFNADIMATSYLALYDAVLQGNRW